MSKDAMLVTLVLWALSAGWPLPAEAEPPAADVPQETIQKIEQQFVRPEQTLPRQEALKLYTNRMETVLRLGADAERKYPNAASIHRVRSRMLMAAEFLAGPRPNGASRKRALDISRRILASSAPAAEKVRPDYHLTLAKLTTATQPAKGAGAVKEIRAYVRRYEKTPAAGAGVLFATLLAERTKQAKLANELLDALDSKHGSDARFGPFLNARGRGPGVGKPFKAELPLLGGGTLKMPDDLKGKVVVVDFWATWCPPCRAAVPHMKKLYADYKPKGLEILGISLDKSKTKLEAYVKDQGIDWVHTFTGKGWGDPTAVKYGIRGIPAVWLVGRDGKVLSKNARANLEEAVKKALEAKPPAKTGEN